MIRVVHSILEYKEIIILDKLYINMSSYGFNASLSSIESNTDDSQTSVNELDTSKQDIITNAPVLGGQAILDGLFLNKIDTKNSTLTIETSNKIIKLGVDKTVIQEKLVAVNDATGSKAVLSGTTVRSVGTDNTLTITEANNIINLAVDKTKIQEKLTAGTLPPLVVESEPVLTGSTIKGLVGERGVSLESTDNYVRVIGPPSAEWTSGLVGDTHYIDTGPTELTIRNASSLPVAKFTNASKDIRAYGSLTTDGGLTVKGSANFFDAVEIVKSDTDATSGLIQVPTVITKSITPIAPETSVKILNLTADSISSLPDS